MFEAGALRRIELIPVTLQVAQVARARGDDFKAIAARMQQLCAELGTGLERQADRLVYAPGP
jgi:hypothetical protein